MASGSSKSDESGRNVQRSPNDPRGRGERSQPGKGRSPNDDFRIRVPRKKLLVGDGGGGGVLGVGAKFLFPGFGRRKIGNKVSVFREA